MSTLTVPAGSADTETLAVVQNFARTLPPGDLRDAIAAIPEVLGSGQDLVLAGSTEMLTPAQVAKILGVSRPHVYKVLDEGALPFTVVGTRDRRVSMADMSAYLERAEALRKEAARSTARVRMTRAAVLDEM